MMTTLRLALRPVLIVAACASIAACTNSPPQRQTDMDYRSRPVPTANSAAGPEDRRLTIKSGEGERLNLPWFVRDTQDWVNSQ